MKTLADLVDWYRTAKLLRSKPIVELKKVTLSKLLGMPSTPIPQTDTR